MNNARMELLRNNINMLLAFENKDSNEILNKSRELDKLILLAIKADNYSKTVLGDGLMKEFSSIVDKIQLFDKMYDSMRIVDPIGKKILEIVENEAYETNMVCHEFWQKGKVCDNCISIRAYNENDTVFKIEQNDQNVFMITAVPIDIKHKKVIVEFLKDVTSSLYLQAGEVCKNNSILTTIDHMNQAVVKDELTGLYNRRFINERLPSDLFNSTLKSEPLSLVFADIDYFKAVNDTYGHIAGDQVLKGFADELKKHVRSEKDWIARYGGEEFLICLPNTDIEEAKAISERIRISVMENEFDTSAGKVHITCSFGVNTVCNTTECLTIDGIIEIADKKLYQAKVSGRNKVV